MSENWKIQVSVKLPHDQDNYRDSLVNLRAETREEFDALLEYVTGKAAEIGSSVSTIRGAVNVGNAFPGPGTQAVQQLQQAAAAPYPNQQPQEQGPWSQPQQAAPPAFVQPQQAAPQAAVPPAPSCAHGVMVYRDGSKQGKTWKAYMCPAPKGSAQCDPSWIR